MSNAWCSRNTPRTVRFTVVRATSLPSTGMTTLAGAPGFAMAGGGVSKTSQTVWKRSGEWHLTVSEPGERCHFRAPHDRSPAPRGCEVTGGNRPPSFTPP